MAQSGSTYGGAVPPYPLSYRAGGGGCGCLTLGILAALLALALGCVR